MIINRVYTYFILSIVVIFYFYCVLYYPYAFNYQTDINDYYLINFFFACALLIILQLSLVVGGRRLVKGWFILLYFVYLVASLENSGNEYSILVLSSFATGMLVFVAGPGILNALVFFLLFTWFFEILVVLQQICSTSAEHYFPGTFSNTGIASIYLSLHLPMLHYVLFSRPSKSGRLAASSLSRKVKMTQWILKGRVGIFYLLLLFVLFYDIAVSSRTGVSVFFVSILSLAVRVHRSSLEKHWKQISKRRRIFYFSLAVMTISLFAWCLLHVKRGSTYGHFLLAKISLKHVTDNFWTGTGLGKFSTQYAGWQAAYFRDGNYTANDWLSAGESYIVFNEFIQLFETVGLWGFMLFCIVIFRFFSIKTLNNTPLLYTVKLTMIGILVACLTSYPLHVNALLLLFVFCIVVAILIESRNDICFISVKQVFIRRKWLYFLCLLPVLILGVRRVLYTGDRFLSYLHWQKNISDTSSPPEEVKKSYEIEIEMFQKDGKLLIEYAFYLMKDSSNYLDVIRILEAAKKYHISRKSIEALAHAHAKIGNYNDARINLEWVCFFIPNLFRTKLELLKLYKLSGDMAKARNLYYEIKNMPVKVASFEVDQIKRESETLMNDLDFQ